MAQEVSKKVAIVTGGAGGIGSAIVREFSRKGWNVACLDINDENGNALVSELGSYVVYIHCDLTNYDYLAAAFSKVWSIWGRIDACIHNAGFVDQDSVYMLGLRESDTIPPKPKLACSELCWTAFMYCVRLSIHFMRRNKTPGGKVISTASTLGLYPSTTFPEYSGVKGAIINFVRGAAPELKLRDNITINAIAPGAVPWTPGLIALVEFLGNDCSTPVDNVVQACHRFVEDDGLNGQILEVSGANTSFVPERPYVHREVSKRTSAVFETFFVRTHGERSGLSKI